MAPITTRTLEVTIISGENLSADSRNPAAAATTTTDMYVVVRAESIKWWSTKMAEQGAESGSTLWNEQLMVEMPRHAKSITLEVQRKTAKGVVRSIGLARIAIWEVLAPKEEEMLSYRLRNWEGRTSGVINFSVKKLRDNCGPLTGIPVSWIQPGIVSV